MSAADPLDGASGELDVYERARTLSRPHRARLTPPAGHAVPGAVTGEDDKPKPKPTLVDATDDWLAEQKDRIEAEQERRATAWADTDAEQQAAADAAGEEW